MYSIKHGVKEEKSKLVERLEIFWKNNPAIFQKWHDSIDEKIKINKRSYSAKKEI